MRNPALGAAIFAATLALTACSASAPRHVPSSTASHTPIAVGEDAALIAKRIKGCTDVRAGDIASGGPELLSTATCTIDGHTVNINSWDAPNASEIDTVLASDQQGAYYADGDSWTVTLGDDPMLQEQLTNQADKLLASAINGHTAWPQNPSAEQDIAKAAVASLGGEVHHYTAP